MNNKDIAKVLRKAIESSSYQQPLYGRCGGFEFRDGYTTNHDGNLLAGKIQALADLLEEVE